MKLPFLRNAFESRCWESKWFECKLFSESDFESIIIDEPVAICWSTGLYMSESWNVSYDTSLG